MLAMLLPAQAIATTQAQGETAAPLSIQIPEGFTPPQVPPPSESAKVEPAKESCLPIEPGSADQRAGVAEICTSIVSAAPQASATKALRANEVQAEGGYCETSDSGTWHFKRLKYCLEEMTVEFTLRGEQDQVLGTANLYINTTAELDPRKGTWSESMKVEFDGSRDPMAAVQHLNVSADVSCDLNCETTQKSPWTGAKTLSNANDLAEGTVAYSDVPAVDEKDFTEIKYHLYITHTGSTPTKPNVEWTMPRYVRCNTHLTKEGNESTGCALPSITPPDMELPISTYGAAAVTYGFGQYALPDGWGYRKPMQRALDGDERRKYTCGYKSTVEFVRKPDIVPDDSCDEYPFASTKQGGTDGALCAEITPLLEDDGKYHVYDSDPSRPVTGKEPCVRGHVPGNLNGIAGTAYSNYIQDWRLMEDDSFWVSIPDFYEKVKTGE